jgi:hypothetical protein
MANKKFTELTDLPSPAGADILAIVDDVAGTPITKKVTATNLMSLAPVQSVAGQTGTVTLDADDIDDASTTHKFVTASDVTNLGNLSGTNTGDQDLSSYQLQPSEGAFVDGDKTKLDGIEASADVTDTANVTAAGALMDSEVTNLAQVKAFDSTDYATAAQGATADSALQSVSAGDLTDGNFDGEAILGFDASINDQTGTAYTLLSSDNGKVVVLDNASAVTVTVPSGLGAGFNCSFVQKGAGQVSFSASSTTINNRQSHTKINAQFGVASIVAYAADTFVLAGDTAS